MKVLTDKNNVLVKVCDEFDESMTGGTIKINGVPYEVAVTEVKEAPESFTVGEYLVEKGQIVKNPDFEGDDLETRLSDIEQILIDLLDTI